MRAGAACGDRGHSRPNSVPDVRQPSRRESGAATSHEAGNGSGSESPTSPEKPPLASVAPRGSAGPSGIRRAPLPLPQRRTTLIRESPPRSRPAPDGKRPSASSYGGPSGGSSSSSHSHSSRGGGGASGGSAGSAESGSTVGAPVGADAAAQQLRGLLQMAMADAEMLELIQLVTENNGWTVEDLAEAPHDLKCMELFLLQIPTLPLFHLFPNLTVVKLMHVGLTEMQCLSPLHQVEELWVTENHIRVIEGLANMRCLRKLYLQNNEIDSMAGLPELPALEELWLAGNRIRRIEGLHRVPQLRALWLPRNRIDTLEGAFEPHWRHSAAAAAAHHGRRLSGGGERGRPARGDEEPMMPVGLAIEELNLAGNNIFAFHEMRHLSRLPSLRDVWLSDPLFGENPVCALGNYHTFLLTHLKSVRLLDYVAVVAEQQQLAESIYHKKQLYYSVRLQTVESGMTQMVKCMWRRCREKRAHALEAKVRLEAVLLDLQQDVAEFTHYRRLSRSGRSVVSRCAAGAPPGDAAGGADAGAPDAAATDAYVKSLEPLLNTLKRAIGTREVEMLDLERRCFEARMHMQRHATEFSERLCMELYTGGNVRLEEGTEADEWYLSAKELIECRFDAQKFERFGIRGVEVCRVSRVTSRGLRARFDRRIAELDVDLSDAASRRGLVCLFTGVPSAEWTAGSASPGSAARAEPLLSTRILAKGLEELYPHEPRHGIPLTNSLFAVEHARLLECERLGELGDAAPSANALIGRVVLSRVFLGKCVAETGSIESFDAMATPLLSLTGGRPVLSSQYPADVVSVHRTLPSEPSMRAWFCFDRALVLPEFVVDYYLRPSVAPRNLPPLAEWAAATDQQLLASARRLMPGYVQDVAATAAPADPAGSASPRPGGSAVTASTTARAPGGAKGGSADPVPAAGSPPSELPPPIGCAAASASSTSESHVVKDVSDLRSFGLPALSFLQWCDGTPYDAFADQETEDALQEVAATLDGPGGCGARASGAALSAAASAGGAEEGAAQDSQAAEAAQPAKTPRPGTTFVAALHAYHRDVSAAGSDADGDGRDAPVLRYVNLSGGGIRSITCATSLLANVVELVLRGNGLAELDWEALAASAPVLRTLDLSRNALHTLDGLGAVTFAALQRFDVSCNRLEDPDQLDVLPSAMPQLVELVVFGNAWDPVGPDGAAAPPPSSPAQNLDALCAGLVGPTLQRLNGGAVERRPEVQLCVNRPCAVTPALLRYLTTAVAAAWDPARGELHSLDPADRTKTYRSLFAQTPLPRSEAQLIDATRAERSRRYPHHHHHRHHHHHQPPPPPQQPSDHRHHQDQEQDLDYHHCPHCPPPLEQTTQLVYDTSALHSLDWVSYLPRLTCLSLREHFIRDVTPLVGLKQLRKLDLGGNRIHSVDPLASLPSLESVALNDNCIEDVSRLAELHQLEFLAVSHNRIHTVAPLRACVALVELYATYNAVATVKSLTALRDIPRLSTLDLTGNPCAVAPPPPAAAGVASSPRTPRAGAAAAVEATMPVVVRRSSAAAPAIAAAEHREEYRMFLIFHLKRLKVLDGVSVDQAQTQRAKERFAGRLSREQLLERLNHTPEGAWATVRELNLSFCSLREIAMMEAFRTLSLLRLDHNQLTSLEGLSRLHNLVALNLSHNRLGQCSPPELLGNTLARLTKLESLSLEANGITDLSAMQLRQPQLKFLNLKGNELVRVEGTESLPDMRELLLERNKISQLDCGAAFAGMPKLLDLFLDDNALRMLDNVNQLPCLQTLSAASNRLIDLRALARSLEGSPAAKVSLAGNALCRKADYRVTVVAVLPCVRTLDGRAIGKEERERAEAVYAQGPPVPPNLFLDAQFASTAPRRDGAPPAGAAGSSAAPSQRSITVHTLTLDADHLGGPSGAAGHTTGAMPPSRTSITQRPSMSSTLNPAAAVSTSSRRAGPFGSRFSGVRSMQHLKLAPAPLPQPLPHGSEPALMEPPPSTGSLRPNGQVLLGRHSNAANRPSQRHFK